MSEDREAALAFVEGYGRTWEGWDIAGFVDLFTEDVIYTDHPTEETVVGREALEHYVRKEQAQQGAVAVRMGVPIVDGNRVSAEFWAAGEQATIAGCLIAHIDGGHGRCSHFREYWFEIDGHASPKDGWGD